jgi:hypothetical protein
MGRRIDPTAAILAILLPNYLSLTGDRGGGQTIIFHQRHEFQ